MNIIKRSQRGWDKFTYFLVRPIARWWYMYCQRQIEWYAKEQKRIGKLYKIP